MINLEHSYGQDSHSSAFDCKQLVDAGFSREELYGMRLLDRRRKLSGMQRPGFSVMETQTTWVSSVSNTN